MAYLGRSPSQGVRNRYYKTASGGETSISGALTGGTLTFTDGNYVDVNLNGVTLVAGTDYNTSTANTIAGLSALTASDVVEIVVYDVFSVFSGNVNSDFSVGGNLAVTGTVDIDGGAIDGTAIGASSASTGAFTTVSASSTASIVGHASVGVNAVASTRALTVAGATDGSSSTILQLYNSSLASKFSVRDDGFVDINGAVDMASTLQVDGAITSSSGLTVLNTGAVATLRLEGDVGTAPHAEVQFAHENYTTGYGASIGTFDAGSFGGGLVFKTLASGSASSTPSEVMRIDNSGNLLVGKTASNIATEGIELRANDDVMITQSGDVCLYLNRLSSDGDLIDLRKDGTTVGTIGIQSSGFFIDGESGHEGIRFANGAITPRENGSDSDGASDLGASNNRFKDGYFSGTVYSTSLRGQNDTDTGIDVGDTGSTADNLIFLTGGSERFRVNGSGHLNIGQASTSSPGAGNTTAGTALQSSGLAFFSSASGYVSINRNGDGTRIQFNNSGNTRGTITVTGTSTAYNTSSDRRLKSNIQDAESASAKIDAMQVRQFDWTEDGSHQDYGMIAQELKAIEPLAVSGSEEGDEMMFVDYSKLVPMLIKAVQELKTELNEAKTRIATLEAK